METFKKETVHIKDRDRVERLLSELIKGGASKLQIISDFDHTISRVHLNGHHCTSTYGILKQRPFTNEKFIKQSLQLYSHYHPIEVDPNLTRAQKVPFMIEWYSKIRCLIPESGINKASVQDMVQMSNVGLRDGCDFVFQTLNKHEVPVLIFSAGIGDILNEILRKQDLLYSNVKVIANFLQYDDKDNIIGFKGELIHTFNKNQTSLEGKEYFEYLQCRDNIILLGDSLGDLDMSEGASNINCILKIGFLNHKIKENLPKYMDSFDIVLTDDQTMDVFIDILQSIFHYMGG